MNDDPKPESEEPLASVVPEIPRRERALAAPATLAKIYELFLTTELSLDDLAIDYGVNRLELADAAKKGKWRERKQAIEIELFRSAEDKYRRLIIEHRVPTLERHLEVSKKLEDMIDAALVALKEGKLPMGRSTMVSTLKQLAEALSSATGVSARAAGINDKPFSEGGQTPSEMRKQPLVVINAMPQVPQQIGEPKIVKEEGPVTTENL